MYSLPSEGPEVFHGSRKRLLQLLLTDVLLLPMMLAGIVHFQRCFTMLQWFSYTYCKPVLGPVNPVKRHILGSRTTPATQ